MSLQPNVVDSRYCILLFQLNEIIQVYITKGFHEKSCKEIEIRKFELVSKT